MILHWNQEEAEFHSRIWKAPLPFMFRNKMQWLGHRWEPQLVSDAVTRASSPVRSVCTISSARPLADERFLNCSLQVWRLQRYAVWKNQHCLFSLASIFPNIRVFSNESALRIRWPKCWSFSFSISPSNEYSGLISFRIDLFDLLAVQGTLKSLLQHHSSKASILRCSAF